MIVFNQVQLHQALQSYFDYYHKTRPHRSLGHDSPVPRPVQPPDQGRVVEIPLISELMAHCHKERNHQFLGNSIIQPEMPEFPAAGQIRCRERLGGAFRYYYRDAV